MFKKKEDEKSAELQKYENKYDIHRDAVMLNRFNDEVSSYGEYPVNAQGKTQFEAYCLAKKYIIPSRAGFDITAVNIDLHQEYTDACDKWKAVKAIRDLHPEIYGDHPGNRFIQQARSMFQI